MSTIFSKITSKVKVNQGIIILNIIFFILSFILIITIPFDRAPDEKTHYKYNIEYIIDHKKLPVSGEDDLEAYSSCRDNKYGQVPCLYSYTVYPSLNYVMASGSAVFFNKIFGVSYYLGARMISLFFGLIFLNFVFLISREFLTKRLSFLTTFCIAFIPQILFISSYINQDIHSLASSAFLGYTIIKIYKHGLTMRHSTYLGAATGFMLVSKYNYFILLPFALLLILYHIYKNYSRTNIKELSKKALATLSIIFGISGFWYIRNIILYKDILGQNFVLNKMSEFHELGRKLPFNFESFKEIVLNKNFAWLEGSFNSFFAGFDYMKLWLPSEFYTMIKVFLFISTTFILYELIQKKKWKMVGYFVSLLIFILLTMILSFYNSITYDLQRQGRYLFPIIIPSLIWISYFIKDNPKSEIFIKIFAGIIALIVYQSFLLILSTYL